MEIPKHKPLYPSDSRRDSNRQSSRNEATPGYLRSTASAAHKYNNRKRSSTDLLSSLTSSSLSGGDSKRLRPNEDHPSYHSNHNARLSNISTHSQYKRRSSQHLHSQLPREDTTTYTVDDETDKHLYLTAKYLQYQYLFVKTERHIQQLKETTQQELDTMKKAVDIKQEEELLRMEDKNQLMKFISQLNRVIDKIQYRLEAEEEQDWTVGSVAVDEFAEEKETLQAILSEMRDLSIPSNSTHEDIKLIMEVRQSIQDFIEQE